MTAPASEPTMRSDAFLPRWDRSSRHAVVTRVSPEAVWRRLETLDLADDPLVRVLLTLRGLGGGGFSWQRAERFGFVRLVEAPPEELGHGLVGRPWRPFRADIQRLSPAEFRAFDEPGFAKVVWAWRMTPTPQGTTVATTTRIRCTDLAALRSFDRYWRVVGPFSGVIRRRSLRLVTDLRRAR